MALERLHAIRSQKEKKGKEVEVTKGCSWYCASADSNYCYFNQVNNDPGPYTDEDIATHLAMTPAQVVKTYDSGMQRLKNIKNTPDMQELKETLIDVTNRNVDLTVYLPDNFLGSPIPTEAKADQEEDEDIPKDTVAKKIRKKNHLYGLYSQDTLKRLKKERDATFKTKPAKKG